MKLTVERVHPDYRMRAAKLRSRKFRCGGYSGCALKPRRSVQTTRCRIRPSVGDACTFAWSQPKRSRITPFPFPGRGCCDPWAGLAKSDSGLPGQALRQSPCEGVPYGGIQERTQAERIMDTGSDLHRHGGSGAESAKAVDPVCGMTVDPQTAKHQSIHQGRSVFLLLCRLQIQVRGRSRSLHK